MVQDLYGSPSRARAFLEVIFHRPGHVARDEGPGDRDATCGVVSDLVEGLGIQIQIPRLAFGTAILDEDSDGPLRPSDFGARPAPSRHAVVRLIERRDVLAEDR